MDECAAPPLLRKELRGYFETVRQADVGIKRAQELCASLSPGLRVFAVDALHSYWLQKVFWLRNIDVGPLHVEVAQTVMSEFFAPKERLEWDREMLVIRRGVAIWNGATAVGRSAVLGADMMVESATLRESCRLFALTYLEIFRLDLNTFEDIIAQHPTIAKDVRMAVCWQVLKKGIVNYALNVALERAKQQKMSGDQSNDAIITRYMASRPTAFLSAGTNFTDGSHISDHRTSRADPRDVVLGRLQKDVKGLHKMLKALTKNLGHAEADNTESEDDDDDDSNLLDSLTTARQSTLSQRSSIKNSPRPRPSEVFR
jgi:hypothetical protein